MNCRSSLSPDIAIRISKATGTIPESWLFLQAKLDLWNASNHESHVEPFDPQKAA
ncbi:MAG: hypothetical protein U5R06_16920 [candidate division KSB1 bacterium]|nr:hypothetical protein [candidate division KSB1 bacterium]